MAGRAVLGIGKPFTTFSPSVPLNQEGVGAVRIREKGEGWGKEEDWGTQRLCLLFEAKSPQLLSTDLGISHLFPLMKTDTSTCGLLASLFASTAKMDSTSESWFYHKVMSGLRQAMCHSGPELFMSGMKILIK